MKIVVTGGAGFIGSRLATALLEKGEAIDAQGKARSISQLVILDMMVPNNLPDDPRLKVVVGQANNQNTLEEALAGADCVFHLASVVSGEAEADLQLGLSVNLDGTRMLLDILAKATNRAQLIFASSIAVYGEGSELVTDATAAFPKNSYGVQKVCCELLIGDYSRRGLIDGRALRFPTVAIRPGKPNKANSSFVSNIIREPLAGRKTVCPVPIELEMPLLSPGKLVEALLKVQAISDEDFDWPRTLLLPSVKVSVVQLLEALELVSDKETRQLVSFEIDDAINSMVQTWPVNMQADRALALGIDINVDALEIVREFLNDNVLNN